MIPLKIHVERAVRPVRATDHRKDRMREELYAHLTALYQEELARLGDEEAALNRARERFGEPAEVTRALQDSVPWIERIGWLPVLPDRLHDRHKARLDRWFRCQDGETIVHFALRLAFGYVAFVGFLFLLLLFALPLLRGKPVDPFAYRLMPCIMVFAAVDFFVFRLLSHGVRQALFAGRGNPPCWFKAAGMILLATALVFVSLVVGTGAILVYDDRQMMGHVVGVAALVASVTPLFLVLGAWSTAQDLRRRREWGCLDLT